MSAKTIRINDFWDSVADEYLRNNFGYFPLVHIAIVLFSRLLKIHSGANIEYTPSEYKIMYRAVKLNLISKKDLTSWLRLKSNSTIGEYVKSLSNPDRTILFFGTKRRNTSGAAK